MSKPWLPLTAVCIGSFLFLLDTTVVTVASPALVSDFQAGPAAVPWVLNIYTLILAMLMLPMGGWADRWGHRQTFIAGLALFACWRPWKTAHRRTVEMPVPGHKNCPVAATISAHPSM